ncbi:hypothetical protein J6590_039105 [Homalodisca vitripennis]|nr:hypothetical protein J6590_039105 [Homalodisca vitripennis]
MRIASIPKATAQSIAQLCPDITFSAASTPQQSKVRHQDTRDRDQLHSQSLSCAQILRSLQPPLHNKVKFGIRTHVIETNCTVNRSVVPRYYVHCSLHSTTK